jgi:phosphatidylglycerophosphate synthase
MRSKLSNSITNICCKLGIHPNTITSSGIISSLVALILGLYILKNKGNKTLNKGFLISLIIVLFSFKVLGDCFDGAVARACNKVSELGGLLDGVSDMLFLMAVAWLMFSSMFKDISIYWGALMSLLVILLWVLVLVFVGGPIVMIDHKMIKEGESILNTTMWFIIDNIVITSAIFITIVAYLLYKY